MIRMKKLELMGQDMTCQVLWLVEALEQGIRADRIDLQVLGGVLYKNLDKV